MRHQDHEVAPPLQKLQVSARAYLDVHHKSERKCEWEDGQGADKRHEMWSSHTHRSAQAPPTAAAAAAAAARLVGHISKDCTQHTCQCLDSNGRRANRAGNAQGSRAAMKVVKAMYGTLYQQTRVS